MRQQLIALCEQTHSGPRGLAAGDHIWCGCYTVTLANPQEEAKIRQLLDQIDINKKADEQRRVANWHKNNPGKEECVYEGPEFVGAKWAEADVPYEGMCGDTSADQMIQMLNDLHKQQRDQ